MAHHPPTPLCVLIHTPSINPNPAGLAPALHEPTHHTTAYIADIAGRTPIALSTRTAHLHWRALNHLRRAIVFHWTKLGHSCRAGARAFVEETSAPHGHVAAVLPHQLLRLRSVLLELGVERVVGTLAWIEDHELAVLAVRLDREGLVAGERWCAGCARVFEGAFLGISAATLTAREPMGVKACGHVLCRECVLGWVNGGEAERMQPCCARLVG
ncbi:hypothetical protein GTA08_BOTSDO08489 [Neofusicoccum parvum]|uniref:Uncharacterized protein n=1 Tax=Neofusicoccum parvum TaxID=310453 RepID=A0ACB5SB98_9PEZI|nr:hypothetical protein GTA08_BOTSDO08489 [Neofusicoccum parvum]